ncbi:MAG TPA: CDP-diacylglycerol--glycerol-3-phosphate 3-phosphatidyltransferase [Syntrophales bacterium]|nr:CDP-diacylglycerol--glycerol-3-phosphate 3-phosphatidyltransferase [Syntrophales bacterium]
MFGNIKDSFEKLVIGDKKEELFNLPNIITMLRVGVIPVLFVILYDPGRFLSLVVSACFIFAALTDLLDGYIARKYGIVTKVGKLLDPIADKLVVNTAMILMIPLGRIQAWAVALFIMRDIAVDGLRHIAMTRGLVIPASPLGKQKTFSQIIAVSALLIHYPLFGIDAHIVGTAVLYIALFMTLWSGADYIVRFYRWVNSGG